MIKLFLTLFLSYFLGGDIIKHHMSTLSDNSVQNIKLIKQLARNTFPTHQILADLTTAQAILESRLNGKASDLAQKYNNLFGQKAGNLIPRGTKGVVYLPTKEVYNGKTVETKAGFLWNEKLEDSLEQRKELLQKAPRYQNLWQAESFEEAANMIRLDGYATDPNYSRELIRVYETYLKN